MPGVVAVRYCVAQMHTRSEPTQGDLVAREQRARQLSNIIKPHLHRCTDFIARWLFEQGQWIKGGKNAIKWTRLSCCSFAANAVRLQLHALAYNLANFMRTLALPEAVAQ